MTPAVKVAGLSVLAVILFILAIMCAVGTALQNIPNTLGNILTALLAAGTLGSLFGALNTQRRFARWGRTIAELAREPLEPGTSTTLRIYQGRTASNLRLMLDCECRETTYPDGETAVHKTLHEFPVIRADRLESRGYPPTPLWTGSLQIPTGIEPSQTPVGMNTRSVDWRLRVEVAVQEGDKVIQTFTFRVRDPQSPPPKTGWR